jgi:predicted O-methyltransferase YrrM
MSTGNPVLDYVLAFSMPETPQMKHIHRETWLKTSYPNMLSGPELGGFLRVLSLLLQPKIIVEIGTFTGYGSLCLAEGLAPGGKLHTFERNPELVPMIHRHLDGHGMGDQIELHTEDALEGISHIHGSFDLVFIDGEKKEYIDYYKKVLPRMNAGGLILADNVLWSGKAADPDQNDPDTLAIRAFNEYVHQDQSCHHFLLPLRDGLMLILPLASKS